MKKFLTVLLVIAVMFTFSFGSAFAAEPTQGTTTTNQQQLDKAYEAAKTNLLAVKNAVVEKLAAEYVETIGCGSTDHTHAAMNTIELTIAKSVYAQVAETIYADYMEVLAIQYDKDSEAGKAALTDAALTGDYGTLVGKAVGDVDTEEKFKSVLTGSNSPYLANVLKAEFTNYKEEVKTELSKIDVSLYSDDVMDADDPYAVTYRALAEKTKAEWIADAEDVTLAADATLYDAVEALCELNVMIKSDKIVGKITYVNADGKTVNVTYRFADGAVKGYDNTPLVISDNLDKVAATKEAVIASKKAEIAKNAAGYYAYFAQQTGVTTEQLNAAKKMADAYQEVMNNRVENASVPADVTVPTVNSEDWTILTAKYDKAEKEAAAYKVMVDATGKLMYKASVIDENLEDAMAEIYDGDADYSYNLTKGAANVEEDLDWAKKVAIAAAEDERDDILYQADGTANYYDIEAAKIAAKYDALIAKIEAAASVDQVNAIDKNVSLTGIKDKAGVNTQVAGLSKFATEYTKLENYVKYLNGDTKSWQDGYKEMISREALAKFYAKNGARTNAEIVALIDAAKAEMDAIPTKAEAKAAKKAVEEQVAALPSYITLAEKEAVESAWTAADDLGVAIDNQAKLTNAVAQLKAADEYAIEKAFKALPSVSKVTTANKADIDELAAAVKAYETETMYKVDGKFAEYTKYDIDAYKKAVRDAAKAEVIAAIAAVDADDEKSVEAARAAYDAFVEEYTDAHESYKAAAQVNIINLEKLLYAEAQIAAAKIEAVEALKITAKSSAKKGSITVKWTVKGDTSAVEAYEIWKSTKHSSGYKKAFTTEKMSYKNTKGLKKGTRYYYKVRAIAHVNGEKITSDWSNKARRIAK